MSEPPSAPSESVHTTQKRAASKRPSRQVRAGEGEHLVEAIDQAFLPMTAGNSFAPGSA